MKPPTLTDREAQKFVIEQCSAPGSNTQERLAQRAYARGYAAGCAAQRADDLDWIRSEARDCGCSDRIVARIEAQDDKYACCGGLKGYPHETGCLSD